MIRLLMAGERIKSGQACYVADNGLVFGSWAHPSFLNDFDEWFEQAKQRAMFRVTYEVAQKDIFDAITRSLCIPASMLQGECRYR